MIQAFALVLATSFAAPSPQLSVLLAPGSTVGHLCHSPEERCPRDLIRARATAPIKASSGKARKVRTITIRLPKSS